MTSELSTRQRWGRGLLALVLAGVAALAALIFCVLTLGGTEITHTFGDSPGVLHCGTTVEVAFGDGPTGPGGEVHDQEVRDVRCRAAAEDRMWWALPPGLVAVLALAGLLWATRGIAAPASDARPTPDQGSGT